MTQGSLFDTADEPTRYDNMPAPPAPEARARRSDPASSHAAAEAMNKSAATGEQAALILGVVRQGGGWTGYEIAEATGLDNVQVARRLSGIKEIRKGDDTVARKCRVSGKRLATYWLRAIFEEGDE